MNEFGALKSLALCAPQRSFSYPHEHLHYERADALKCAQEIIALRDFYESHNITVHLMSADIFETNSSESQDFFFCRDQVIRVPGGIVLCPMGVDQRKNEFSVLQAYWREQSHSLRVFDLFSAHDAIEGADVLWIDDFNVLVGVGKRTSMASAHRLATFLADFSVRAHLVPIEHQVSQHLLGIVQFIAPMHALVRTSVATKELLQALTKLGVKVEAIAESVEVAQWQAMNFVMLSPTQLVMSSRGQALVPYYESLGLHCHLIEIDECTKAAGGVACLTGILERA